MTAPCFLVILALAGSGALSPANHRDPTNVKTTASSRGLVNGTSALRDMARAPPALRVDLSRELSCARCPSNCASCTQTECTRCSAASVGDNPDPRWFALLLILAIPCCWKRGDRWKWVPPVIIYSLARMLNQLCANSCCHTLLRVYGEEPVPCEAAHYELNEKGIYCDDCSIAATSRAQTQPAAAARENQVPETGAAKIDTFLVTVSDAGPVGLDLAVAPRGSDAQGHVTVTRNPHADMNSPFGAVRPGDYLRSVNGTLVRDVEHCIELMRARPTPSTLEFTRED